MMASTSSATFLGYRDADGNEMHCARDICLECTICRNPIARPNTQKRDPVSVGSASSVKPTSRISPPALRRRGR